MENSRHERAIIVAASYVIGFTSAYIAFGVAATDYQHKITLPPTQPQTETTVAEEERTVLRLEETGLVAVTEDLERLLSAHRSSPLAANVVGATPEPGMAHSLVEAELSRDGAYVYFCEALTADAQTCDPYVYDVAADTLHPVRVNGTDYYPQIDEHRSSWTPSGYLTVNQFRSISPGMPWLLK